MKAKSEAAETKTFRLSDRLNVTFTAGPAGMTAEWSPCLPVKFTLEEAQAYRKGRDEMLQRLAARLGGAVACVEV